jgi:prefoldin beta subunit
MENQNKKLQEMQFIEQNLQNLLMQKQSFQLELSETESAIKELERSGDEVFKIIGQLMIKTDKKKIAGELENKKKLLNLRLNSFEKQEKTLSEQYTKIREEFLENSKNN